MKSSVNNFILYILHSFIFCIIMFLFIAGFCFFFKFNPLIFYQNAEWAKSSDNSAIEAQTPSIAQTIADAKSAWENQQAAVTETVIENIQPIQETNEELETAKASARTVSRPYATLSIDRLGMNVPIYYGDDSATLKKGPGQYSGSSLPGEGSQILIAGHNTSHFKPLQNIEIGDIIRISTEYGEFNYSVVTTRVASMKDTSTYNLSLDHEQLVLYTCYPFTGPPGKTERFFVYADRIS